MSRAEVIAARLAAQHLDRRLPFADRGRATRCGLQDGAPRSAVLALYARVDGVAADAWAAPDLAQVWGPRGAVWVVPADDLAVFTVGLLPRDERLREAAERDADALADALGDDRVRKRDALVPDADRRRAVWPLGVAQPGALLADGEIVGTWRRRGHRMAVTAFEELAPGTRRAAEEEAAGFPLDLDREVEVRWTSA